MATTTTYAESLARRILAGSGALSLVPYELDPDAHLPVLLHGLDAHGRLTVAATAPGAERMGDGPVRIDGVKKALEFDVDVTVASVHALARITWLAPGEMAPGIDFVPPPHLRLGVIETESVHVHGPHGATKCAYVDVIRGAGDGDPAALGGLDAREQVERLSTGQLSELLAGVLAGHVPGLVLADREQRVCAKHRDRLWIGDIDAEGIVLLSSANDRMSVVMVQFPERVSSITDLAWALESLAPQTSAR